MTPSTPHFRRLEHPLVADRLRTMRDQGTGREAFVLALEQLSLLLAATATASLDVAPVRVQTPLEETDGHRLMQPTLLVPILRAGLGMLRSFQQVLPEAAVAFFGVSRNEETLLPKIYLDKIPELTASTTVFVLDPMLATGHSACVTIGRLQERGAGTIQLICCLAAPEGIAEVARHYPGVDILVAAVDRQLNERGFILPGLGDAGDRQFG